MKLILILIAVPVVLAGALALYARLVPIEADRFTSKPGPDAAGVHRMPGGAKYVLPLSDLPKDALVNLLGIVRQTPRTIEIATDNGNSFVTRSRGFGFPDVTRIWQDEDNLHIHAHLVIGKSDLGVNGDRVRQWNEALRGSLR
ncbi:DUF1499 domain-containing protein [Aliiroseovarius sp. PrR006]|uniref:DUF1499 domain-containing protein n=1 Tax=Aliiroseovarius sp. PrR006 TaxID=2706883 RepID=UPI0013D2596B|nr:DUF1499 domain-containing protein [Aliiroseovarius sp. PrR006]NDW52375.1 DUF1499 domain-containing protein [Aliiroseovarius sp. PrR006]